MRRGEIVGLQWGDIDFDAATILVRLTHTTIGRTIITKSPKNGRARVISVDTDTLAALAELRRPWVRSDDFVVLDPDGEPLHPDRLSQLFRKLVRYSGLRPIRFHDLRHTHASLLIKAGVPVKVVTERLGHADPGFTMRVYQHVLPGMQAAAAEAFAELVRDASPERASGSQESTFSAPFLVNPLVNRTEPDGPE